MLIITTQEELDKACSLLTLESALGIDTEFERKYQYFAKLSTIQIVSQNHNYIIDWLALSKQSVDFSSLKDVLYSNKILKILHSSRQDLEIFYQIFHDIPELIFDTQIAANVCGYGTSISYGNLCNLLFAVTINKKYQRADWMKRPISSQMIQYALNDAKYLIPIYSKLNSLMQDNKLINSYQMRLETILSLDNFALDKENSWKKVKFNKFSRELNKKMRIIAGLREECAREANIARKHFATDDDLITICHVLPTTQEELNSLRLSKHHITSARFCNKLLAECARLKNN